MVKDEILIGRRVDQGNYIVDEKYKAVSRIHAKVVRSSYDFYIEDLDSANGTYVNGSRVFKKRITCSDSVYLGGLDAFCLPVGEVLRMFPLSDKDFTNKVLELKDIYDTYQEQSTLLQSQQQEGMMMKRMLPTTILGSLTAILAVCVGDDPTIKVAISLFGAVMSVIVFFASTKWASSSNLKIKEELRHLNEKFEMEYVCPACGVSFKGKSWEFIKRGGKCPACKKIFNIN